MNTFAVPESLLKIAFSCLAILAFNGKE